LNLATENQVAPEIITHRRQDRRIRSKRYRRQGPALITFEPTHQLSGNVLGVGGTATITQNVDPTGILETFQYPRRHRFDNANLLPQRRQAPLMIVDLIQ